MKYNLLIILLATSSIAKSQTVDHSNWINSKNYALDSITTILGGAETDDTIPNKRIVFLMDSNSVHGSVSRHDKFHSYRLSIYGSYLKDSLIRIRIKSHIRKFATESIFAKTAKIGEGQNLILLLSDSSTLLLKAHNVSTSTFPYIGFNYYHYHFDVDYTITEQDVEKLKRNRILKLVQDYGNGFFLVVSVGS